MEITIVKRLPLAFDENGSTIVEFDFKALQEEHEKYSINKSSQMTTVTDNHVLLTFKASEKGKSKSVKARTINHSTKDQFWA